jgi:hypothetical protein
MEMLEKINLFIAITDEDKCPFCQYEPIGHKSGKSKEKLNSEVKSVPKELNCKNMDYWNSGIDEGRNKKDLRFTIAQHHLISAKQCYGRIKPLVRMGNDTEYNINCKENGIGLPTVHYSLNYPIRYKEVGNQKSTTICSPLSQCIPDERYQYGKLIEKCREEVAYSLMEELGAQWHVGHHSITIDNVSKEVDGADESSEDDVPHEVSYDTKVIQQLLAIASTIEPLCEYENAGDIFKKIMDLLSNEIKSDLMKFKSNNLEKIKTCEYFVSKMSLQYARNVGGPVNIHVDCNSEQEKLEFK